MQTAIVTALVGLFCTTISSLITFFLTRRKYNSEVDSQQIKNMNESFDLFKKMTDVTFESQKKLMEDTIFAQNQKIEILQKENDSLKTQVSQLQQQMLNLLGSICLDSQCKLRKMNFTSDLMFSDNGPQLIDTRN